MKYITHIEDQEYIIEIEQDDEIIVNGQKYQIDIRRFGESGVMSMLLNNRSIEAVVDQQENTTYEVLMRGELYTVQVQDERSYRLAQARKAVGGASGEMMVKAPMPGVIVSTPVAEKSMVKKGETVVILESMKMENELKAPRDGMVKRVHVEAGVNVDKNQTLVTVGDPES
jgi:biotin carboxyl carrier protein